MTNTAKNNYHISYDSDQDSTFIEFPENTRNFTYPEQLYKYIKYGKWDLLIFRWLINIGKIIVKDDLEETLSLGCPLMEEYRQKLLVDLQTVKYFLDTTKVHNSQIIEFLGTGYIELIKEVKDNKPLSD